MIQHLTLTVVAIIFFMTSSTLCSVGDNENLWRVNQEPLSNDARIYSVRVPLEVEYFGEDHDFVMWGAPAHCVATHVRDLSSKIICSIAGVHNVKMLHRIDGKRVVESRPLIMKKSPLCYRWYVVTFVGSKDRNGDIDNMIVRVWIWDPVHASIGEIKQTATTPSPFSLTLSKVFADKGQVPVMTEYLPDPRSEWDWTNHTFDSSQGYWEFNLAVSRSLTRSVFVTGKPNIAAHGCFIRNTMALVPWPNTDEVKAVLVSEGNLALRGQAGVSMVITDPCNRAVAFLIMSEQCHMTLDGFKTTFAVMVPSSLLQNETSTVTDIVITSISMLFLLSDGSVLAQSRHFGTFSQFEVPDDTPLLALQGKEWCQHSRTHAYDNKMFLGWTDHVLYIWQGTTLMSTIDVEQLGASLMPNPFWISDEEHVEMKISIAGFAAESMEAAILLQLSDDHSTVSAFVQWDIATNSLLGARTFFFHQKRQDDAISFINTYGAEKNIIFWDTRSVYYSYSQGSDIAEMPLFNDPDESEVDDGIKQVVVTVSGYVIAVSTSNVLYTSQVYQESLIRHFSLAMAESDLVIYTNQNDEVYLLMFQDSVLKRISYSLKPEIKSITDIIDHNACQYIYFEQCPLYRIYYLDVRDEAVVWAELIHISEKYNDIKTIVSIPEKIKIQETVYTDFYPGRRSVKKVLRIESSFTFAQPGNYSEALAAASGFVTLEMRPQRLGVGCRSPHNMVSHLEMGCPPNRHIRVPKPEECDDGGSFTIDPRAYMLPDGQEPTQEKVIEYNKRVYGCPITVSVKETFKPVIELYDDDFLVENMTANFVMWEDSWRTDFDYTLTMKRAGCLQEAQTWNMMRSRAGPDTPVNEVWGPHNYESCFIYELTELELLKNSYQVLNQSGANSIRWLTAGDNNLFLFSIKVVDPYYSFCILETKVAVIVLGRGVVDDPRTAVLRISLGTFAGITGSLLLISYVVYRRYHIRELELELLDNYEDRPGEDSTEEPETAEKE